jgi:cytochrome c biogenesis protein CcdA
MDIVTVSTAAWLGILTAISPCPMATNIAAISLIGKEAGNKSKVLFSGLMYTLGRTLAYLTIGMLLSSGLTASSNMSLFLQKYLNEALGPILIIIGMVLADMLNLRFKLSMQSDNLQEKAVKNGGIYSFPLGVIFALSFCPVSAGLFFGAMIPLAVKAGSNIIIPSVYGIATAIPVIVFAFIIAFSAEYLSKAFNKLNQLESYVRKTTALIFIIAGIYYCLRYNLEFFS